MKKKGDDEARLRKALDNAMPMGFKHTAHIDPLAVESAHNMGPGFNRTAEGSMPANPNPIANQMSGGAPFVGRGPTMYVDPMFDPILFLFPKDRIDEINKRLRHYYETNPVVGSAIDLHSSFPISDFYLECENRDTQEYWNDFKDRTGLLDFLRCMVHDFWLLGEGIGYPVWDEYNFEFSHFNQYPPENIDIVQSYVTPKKYFLLKPDPKLAEKMKSTATLDVAMRNMMDPAFIQATSENKPFMLGSDDKVMYLARQTTKYRARGVSILSRALKSLLYLDKLRLLQLTYCDRHFHPLKIFKLGSETRGWIPNKKHFQRLQQLLANAQNDPDFCFDEKTQLLTESGWKGVGEFADGEKIATFNPGTEKIEYQVPESWNVKDYDGDMYQFQNKSGGIDMLVTPNHRLWVRPDGKNARGKEYSWRFVKAKDMRGTCKFRSVAGWDGSLDVSRYGGPIIESAATEGSNAGNLLVVTKTKPAIRFGNALVELEDVMRLAGWYISEGCGWKAKGYVTKPIRVHITQNEEKKLHADMVDFMGKSPFPISMYGRKTSSGKPHACFGIYDQDINKFLVDNFGMGSFNKHVPTWVKMLPKEYLTILIGAMMDGDGSSGVRFGVPQRMYYTSSKDLVGDVQEIALKIGWTSSIYELPAGSNGYTQAHYHILLQSVSDRKRPRKSFPLIRKRHISKVHYAGKIFCPTVPPHHLVIARRNGAIAISGQSILYHFGLTVDYVGTKDKIANLIPEFEFGYKEIMAALFVNEEIVHGGLPSTVRDTVNMRMLMTRYTDVRDKIERMMITHVFLPIARARGFYRKSRKAEAIAQETMLKRVASKEVPIQGEFLDKEKKMFRIANSHCGAIDLSVYDLPRPIWKKMNLVNNAAEQQLLLALEADGKIPMDMVFDALGIDPRTVRTKLKEQESTQFDPLWRQIRDAVGMDKNVRMQVLDGKTHDEWKIPEGAELDENTQPLGKGSAPKKPLPPLGGGSGAPPTGSEKPKPKMPEPSAGATPPPAMPKPPVAVKPPVGGTPAPTVTPPGPMPGGAPAA